MAVSSSNSVGGPVSRRDTTCRIEDLVGESRERHRVDGPPVDLEPLAIRDEVRLGRRAGADAGRAQRAPGDGQDAALAVRPADEGATQLELRITERMQEGACSSQSQSNAEAAPIGKCLDRAWYAAACANATGRSTRRAQRTLSSSS
jgi:hypothetical protein